MTVVNPKSISGINSITTGSGSDDLLTIHTNNTTERVRINSSGLRLPDSQKLMLGDTSSGDLQISHDGTNSIINNAEGSLLLQNNGTSSFYITNAGLNYLNNDTVFVGASANVVWDKSDNSIQHADNAKSKFGTGNDLQIFFDGTHSKIEHTPATGSLFLAGDGVVLANSGMSQYYLQATENGAVLLNHSGTTRLTTSSDGITVTSGSHDGGLKILSGNNNQSTRLQIQGKDSGGTAHNWYAEVPRGSDILNFFADVTGSVMKLDKSGDMTVIDGDLVIGTSGHGIDFAATGDSSGTTSSEVLDDYEVGTFTPTVEGTSIGGYAQQHGRYVKVGKLVTVNVKLQFSANTAGGAQFKVAGLPYTSASTNGETYGSGGITYSNLPLSSADYDPYIGTNATKVEFYVKNTGANISLASNASSKFFGFAAMYYVA